MTTPQRTDIYDGNYEVNSSNSAITWLVQIHKLFENVEHGKVKMRTIAFCQCPAYRYSGDFGKQTCKHITRVLHFQLGTPDPGVKFLSGSKTAPSVSRSDQV